MKLCLVVVLIIALVHAKKLSFDELAKIPPKNKDLGCPSPLYISTSGTLNSPNFPNVYPSGIKCSYRIVEASGNRIQLNFNNVLLPTDGEILVYDGIDQDSAILYSINATQNTAAFRVKAPIGGGGNPVMSASNAVYIQFNGGTQLSADTKYGFNANFTTFNGYPAIYYTNSTGMLTSPNYPFNYPNNKDQLYFITTPITSYNANPRLQLRITDFVTEEGYDYLRIVDGNSIGGQLIAQYTGSPQIPIVVNSSSNAITLYFHSDQAVNFRGFSLFWLTI